MRDAMREHAVLPAPAPAMTSNGWASARRAMLDREPLRVVELVGRGGANRGGESWREGNMVRLLFAREGGNITT